MATEDNEAINSSVENLHLGELEENLDGHLNDLTEDEKRQVEAHKLASLCYCEKLNSKEEDETEEIIEDYREDIEEDNVRVKFADTVIVCPTYTSQEYDREPDDDWREKERAVEEMVENLDIVIIETDPVELQGVQFVDFHKMEEVCEEDILCDFGVYVSAIDASSEALDLDIATGDLVLCMDGEDYLSSTAAVFKTNLAKVAKTRVTLTLGRKRK